MRLAIGFVVACLLHVALRAAAVWWFLAACLPLLLVPVAASRKHSPVGVAWWGLFAGLAIDVLSGRIIGPGGIAAAIAGAAMATLVRRFELVGPLFWVGGALLLTAGSEAVWTIIFITFNAPRDHSLLGSLATVATTSAAAMVVAAGERIGLWWRSPQRRRRRELGRL